MRSIVLHLTSLLVFILTPVLCMGDTPPSRLEVTEDMLNSLEGEYWYGLNITDNKVGYLKTALALRDSWGRREWVITQEYKTKYIFKGDKFKDSFSKAIVFDAKPPYAFLEADIEVQSGRRELSYSVHIAPDDKKFKVVIKSGDHTKTSSRDWVDYTLIDELGENIHIRAKGLKEGDAFAYRYLDAGKFTFPVREVVVKKVHGADSGGPDGERAFEFFEKKAGGTAFFLKTVNSSGITVSEKIDNMLSRRTTSESDANDYDYSTDIINLIRVRLDRDIGLPPLDIRCMTLRIDGVGINEIFNEPWYEIEQDKGSLILTSDSNLKNRPPAYDRKENLEETDEYPIKDERVIAMAKKALEGITDEHEKVRKLIETVNEYIEYTLMPNELAVEEILEEKKGDCTEFAQLFTTLARASGIPCREVGGFVFDYDQEAFALHQWNIVSLDKQWIQVDPTWGEMHANPTHIIISEGKNDIGSLILSNELSFSVLSVNRKVLP